MKLKISKLVLFYIGISFLIISSCSKKACTDIDSVNYDSSANKNDGSCEYESKIIFWFDSDFSDLLASTRNVSSLSFHIEGEKINTTNITNFQTVQPDCTQTAIDFVKIALGNLKTGSRIFQIKDNFDRLVMSAEINIDAKECTIIELKPDDSYISKFVGTYKGTFDTNANTTLKYNHVILGSYDTILIAQPCTLIVEEATIPGLFLLRFKVDYFITSGWEAIATESSENELKVTNYDGSSSVLEIPIEINGLFKFDDDVFSSSDIRFKETDQTSGELCSGNLSFSGTK